jgi:outer membrane protein OmpA-like peptidoglycan-associated protein
MNRTHSLVLAAAAAGLLSACASTPQQIEALETARAVVPKVEASPRAGVAATNIAEARKALDQANALFDKGGKVEDITFAANVAARNAEIANEKILTQQAREEIEKGTAERQAVLIEAREAEARSLERQLAELQAKKTDRGLVVTLGDVLFDTGKATLKPGAYSTVDRLAQALKDNPDRKVMIEGYTDSVGSEDYNQVLSERRAQAVQAALFERGVPAEQVSTSGKGEGSPVASNDNAAGRQQNRRVELIFQDSSRVATDTD